MHLLLITGENVKIKRILVFGPIGSGKSSLLELFKQWGAFTVDCDQITHEILDHDPEAQRILKERFGASIFEKGKISREKLASIAFSSKEHLLDLESAIIPRVFTKIKQMYNEKKDFPYNAFVVEASIYPRVGPEWAPFFDEKIAVVANEELCRNRCSHFDQRAPFQLSFDQYKNYADLLIENNQTINELKQQFLKKVAP